MADSSRRSRKRFTRRDFFHAGAAAGAMLLTGPARADEPRELALYNLHTDESISVTYWAAGRYDPVALQAVSRLLRDHRTGASHPISSRLLDLLHALHVQAGGRRPYHVISGYRSPQTNEKLLRLGRGVAKRSLHMRGLAADVRLPGVSTRKLWQTAVALRGGGVGYYPQAGFIHVDVGRVRFWRG